MEASHSSSISEDITRKKEEERIMRWKIKGLLFFIYFGLITFPLTYLSIEILYSNNVLGIIQIPRGTTRFILSILCFLSALIGQYLVSFHILRMTIDKLLDVISFLFCLLFVLGWNYDFQHKKEIYSLVSTNDSVNFIMIFLGIFFLVISLLIINRPKYRFGFFLQSAGITIFANSFLLKMRMIEIPGYTVYLIITIIFSFALFGYSVYYRIKFEYNFDKDY
jgi:hypothetical protein